MIHQLIFAAPKPGLSEAEFHRYWLEEHAVRYAAKIPQIRKYKIDTRLPRPGETPVWNGVAEICVPPAGVDRRLADEVRREHLLPVRVVVVGVVGPQLDPGVDVAVLQQPQEAAHRLDVAGAGGHAAAARSWPVSGSSAPKTSTARSYGVLPSWPRRCSAGPAASRTRTQSAKPCQMASCSGV